MRAEAASLPPVTTGWDPDGAYEDRAEVLGGDDHEEPGPRFKCLMPLWSPGIFACQEWSAKTAHAWEDPWGNQRVFQASGAQCKVRCPHGWQAPDVDTMVCNDGVYRVRERTGSVVEQISCKTAPGAASAILCGLFGCCVLCGIWAYGARRRTAETKNDSRVAEPAPSPRTAGGASQQEGSIHVPLPTVKNIENMGKHSGEQSNRSKKR
mmetsp:Transcript_53402/g.154024  ORF Transcript_53402/g.154024 Transcript_53402/m.154024 type:complete len:209 (+) Transcript_53402:341-967(+)